MDPDGDNLSYLWFYYPEAGSYKNPLTLYCTENTHHAFLKSPVVDKAETAHFILKLTDKGALQRSRYKRVIVTIVP
jgi:hypothetical protein